MASGDAISYQAIARDASGQIIAERPIGVKVEILQGSAEGAAVYSGRTRPQQARRVL